MPRSDGACSIFTDGHKQASTPWVMNEFYVPAEIAEDIIAISKSFNIEARVIGCVENSEQKQVL